MCYVTLDRSNTVMGCSRKTYPDLDARSCGGTQPVPVGAEGERIDDGASVKGVQVLALIQIPQHRLTVLQMATHMITVNMSYTCVQDIR